MFIVEIRLFIGGWKMENIKIKVVTIMLAFSLLVPTVTLDITADAKTKKTYVYYAVNSKKYHCTKNCRTLARSKKIYKVTKKKAEARRLTKCKVCY